MILLFTYLKFSVFGGVSIFELMSRCLCDGSVFFLLTIFWQRDGRGSYMGVKSSG